MSDRTLIELAPGWALSADDLQWILCKADKRGPQAEKRHRRAPWRGVSFIASTKSILRRVLREKGVIPTLEAARYLDAMPDTFQEWHRKRAISHDLPEGNCRNVAAFAMAGRAA